jgi:farnesyl diphosphate synthase
MKTGALIAVSLEIGGIAAGASPDVEGALRAYGRGIGLAFQITDDVLDATSTPTALGKHPSDEALGKSTYVSLLGVDGARAEADHHVARATGALEAAGVESAPLRALARYVVERTR